MNKKALHAVTRARTVLLVSQPFYGTLALQLELVENSIWIDTMAVDGRHMYYNPEFVLSLKEDELVGVVAHEVSHCSYQHMTRRGHRHLDGWNIAGDFVINDDIIQAGFTLPGKPINLNSPPGTKGYLFDPQFKGMSTEEVYERLPQSAKEDSGIMIIVGKGKGNDKDSQGQGNGKGNGKRLIDVGRCGGVLDAAPPHDKSKADQIANEWEANIRMAVNVAMAQNAGKLPGYLERLVKQLKKPKVNWRDQTRQFIDNSMSKDFSWSRPNRRTVSTGVLMPGYIADRIHHLVMVVDISGSVSNDMMRAMVSEAAGALDEGCCDCLTVIYADDGVHHVDTYQTGDLVEAKTFGGGGTDFTDSFKWINENAQDAACVIYLTDLCTSGFGEEPACPVLWATYIHESRYDDVAKNVPWGQPIFVESPQY